MALSAGRAISARSNNGVFTVSVDVPGMLGYKPSAAQTYQAEQRAAHPVDQLLGLPWLADVVVEPRHSEARLVTGPQIRLHEVRGEAAEPVGHRLSSAQGGHQTGDVLRHMPDVLLGVALVEPDLAEAAREGRHDPGALRKETEGITGRDGMGGGGLDRFCQYCALIWNSVAVAESPSASANREMAKSSTDHSSVIDAAGIEPAHDSVLSGR